eukprot:2162656-Pleurochrysis_carterae.AAC.2
MRARARAVASRGWRRTGASRGGRYGRRRRRKAASSAPPARRAAWRCADLVAPAAASHRERESWRSVGNIAAFEDDPEGEKRRTRDEKLRAAASIASQTEAGTSDLSGRKSSESRERGNMMEGRELNQASLRDTE